MPVLLFSLLIGLLLFAGWVYWAMQYSSVYYKAFGIRKGDPMWLDPKDRVRLW